MKAWNVLYGLIFFFQNNALFVNIYRWFLLLIVIKVNFGLGAEISSYQA